MTEQMNQRPLILVSNDDGVDARGIHALAEGMRLLGDVFVMAPDGPRSGMSSAITTTQPITYRVLSEAEGMTICSCSGTPTDCVKLAVSEVLDRKPDLLVSGVNLGEQPLSDDRRVEPRGIRRWAAEFEALRTRSDVYLAAKGTRPQAVLIPLGPLAKHNIRTGFATNLLASGGIEALNPGQVVPGTPEFDTAAQSAPIAVICGTDAEYGETGVEAVQALRKAGVETVLLAGSPASFEGAEAAPDDYLNLKIDAAATLATLLDKLGA